LPHYSLLSVLQISELGFAVTASTTNMRLLEKLLYFYSQKPKSCISDNYYQLRDTKGTHAKVAKTKC